MADTATDSEIDRMLAEYRSHCYCAPYRKPCSTCDAYWYGLLEMGAQVEALLSIVRAAHRVGALGWDRHLERWSVQNDIDCDGLDEQQGALLDRLLGRP